MKTSLAELLQAAARRLHASGIERTPDQVLAYIQDNSYKSGREEAMLKNMLCHRGVWRVFQHNMRRRK